MASSLRFLGKTQSVSRGFGGMRLPSVLAVRREAFQKSRQLVARRFTSSSSKEKAEESTEKMTMLQRFLAPKPMPERNTPAWYREVLLICTVFGITGSSTMMLVRPAVRDVLGIEGSFRDGPWSYRLCNIFLISPVYATLLVAVGTVFGRHAYFRHFSVKIFSRFGIPPELLDKNFHKTKDTFRKW